MGEAVYNLKSVTQHKDEDDSEFETEFVNIKIVSNGFIVTTSLDSGDEFVEVYEYDNGGKMLKDIAESLGLLGKVRIE